MLNSCEGAILNSKLRDFQARHGENGKILSTVLDVWNGMDGVEGRGTIFDGLGSSRT